MKHNTADKVTMLRVLCKIDIKANIPAKNKIVWHSETILTELTDNLLACLGVLDPHKYGHALLILANKSYLSKKSNTVARKVRLMNSTQEVLCAMFARIYSDICKPWC